MKGKFYDFRELFSAGECEEAVIEIVSQVCFAVVKAQQFSWFV